MENKRKSTYSKAIGILDILSGFVFFYLGFFFQHQYDMGYNHRLFSWLTFSSSAVAAFVICVGIVALWRRAWIFVLVGSGIAMLAILGIPAFILTLKSKNEFISLGNHTKLVVAGILDIISGLAIEFIGTGLAIAISINPNGFWDLFTPLPLLEFGLVSAVAIVQIIGGVMAIRRRKWEVAYAASIIACFVLVGIPALILINKYKGEFTTHTTGTGVIDGHNPHSEVLLGPKNASNSRNLILAGVAEIFGALILGFFVGVMATFGGMESSTSDFVISPFGFILLVVALALLVIGIISIVKGIFQNRS